MLVARVAFVRHATARDEGCLPSFESLPGLYPNAQASPARADVRMAEQVNPKRQRAGRKGAKISKRRGQGEAAKGPRAARGLAKKLPRSLRPRAAKKAAKTREARGPAARRRKARLAR